jgi:DNA-binding MarR family transcriptional regulator
VTKESTFNHIEQALRRLVQRNERVRLATPATENGLELDRAAYMVLGQLHVDGPVRMSTLAENIGIDKTTVSRHVAHLEEKALIERVDDPDDGRACLVQLSDEGRARFEQKRDARRAVLREQLADWNEKDRQEFARLLAKYNEAMDQRYGVPTGGSLRKTSKENASS